jgi:hypothetical protein
MITSEIDIMLQHVRSSTSRVDLVVHHTDRAWLMDGENFLADENKVTNSLADLTALASSEFPVIFTFVPRGSGRRIALDRDDDGFFNHTETLVGSDPANPEITPDSTTPRIASVEPIDGAIHVHWWGHPGSKYQVQRRTNLSPASGWEDVGDPITLSTAPGVYTENFLQSAPAYFYRIIFVP